MNEAQKVEQLEQEVGLKICNNWEKNGQNNVSLETAIKDRNDRGINQEECLDLKILNPGFKSVILTMRSNPNREKSR